MLVDAYASERAKLATVRQRSRTAGLTRSGWTLVDGYGYLNAQAAVANAR